MDRFVDGAMAALPNGTRTTWAASTSARQPVVKGTDGYATLALAHAAAASGDVIWFAPGVYSVPASVTKTGLTFRGVGAVTLNVASRVTLPAGEVRFKDLSIAAILLATDMLRVPPGGLAGFVNCTFAGAAYLALVDGSTAAAGAAFAGCTLNGLECRTVSGGAWGKFPGPRTAPGGPQGRKVGEYRHRMAVLAPASHKDAVGHKAKTWVPIDVHRAAIVPVRGTEHDEARVMVAECDHLVRIRGGACVTENMRLKDLDTLQTYDVNRVLAFDGRDNRLDLGCVLGTP